MTDDKKKKEKETSEYRPRGKRLWVILVLAAIAVAALMLSLTLKRIKGTASSDNRPSTFTVRRDNLRVTVTEGGSIRPHDTIEVKCKVEAGRSGITITSIVPEGTYITQEDVDNGKVLVRLDSAALEENLTQREIDFASAEASYTQAKEANDIQVNQNESSIADAELRVRFALMDLQKYLGESATGSLAEGLNKGAYAAYHIASLLEDSNSLEGSASGAEIKRLKDNIVLSEQQLEKARDRLAGTIKLHDANYVSDLELKTDQLSVTSSTFKKERDGLTMDLFKLYDFPKQVEQLLSDYEESKRKLERTYAECRSRLAQRQADLKSAESRYQSRKERLNKTIRNIEYCIIKAPAPGLVTYGSGSSGDHWRRMRGSGIIAEGETVHERQTIISLPDTAEMIAEIDVHESSIDKVRPGQRAKVVMDAFPDRTLEGEVLKVAPLPNQERGWFSPDLKVYTTQVVIDGSHDFLKPGMSAKVEILVERLEDVIIVPVQVVANQEGKKVCYCLSSNRIERRVVQTGSFNDTFVAIIDGLEVGEEVLLSPPRMIEAKVEAKPKTEEGEEPKEQEKPKGREAPKEREASKERGEPKKREEPRQERQMELTDEAIERIMGFLAQRNPEKAEELKQLRESDPEKFKTELRKLMREQFGRSRRGGGDTGRRGGDTRDRQNP